MLCCLLKPTKGTARVAGYDVLKEPEKVKSHIGVSPQETVLSERLNSWENLSLFGNIYGIGSKEIRRRSEELLERVGLLDRAKDQVRKFSGGMKRRLNSSSLSSTIHRFSSWTSPPWDLTLNLEERYGNTSKVSKAKRPSFSPPTIWKRQTSSPTE